MVQNGQIWPKRVKKKSEKNVKKYFSKVGGMGPKALIFFISVWPHPRLPSADSPPPPTARRDDLGEGGGEWPQGMQQGRVAYLEKEPGECEYALKFRPLVLLPALYMRWASGRLETSCLWSEKGSLTLIYAEPQPWEYP